MVRSYLHTHWSVHGFWGGGWFKFKWVFCIHIEIILFTVYSSFWFLWQRVVSDVTAAHDRELLFQANENLIVKIQANYRGYQARKAYKERLDFMKRQLPLIIKIQVRDELKQLNSTYWIKCYSSQKNKTFTSSVWIDSDLCIIYFYYISK